jgi:hypothetical protein
MRSRLRNLLARAARALIYVKPSKKRGPPAAESPAVSARLRAGLSGAGENCV